MLSTHFQKTASVSAWNLNYFDFHKLVTFLLDLPAGILQEEFFSSNRPKYMNYGAIGSVIGHEIIHGYDDKGRQYDKNGNLVDWWEDETNNNFVKRAQCYIDQYTKYEDVYVHLNVIRFL